MGDYEWDPIEFTTEDGYILTSFIISKKGEEMRNPPILVHHDHGQDAASWLETLKSDGTPFMFNFVDNSFPVWMINNRGTEYSRRHNTLEPISKEFWDFDMFDMYEDIKANIDIVRYYLGFDIMWYIGYSGATT